jgi:hypothetical protein
VLEELHRFSIGGAINRVEGLHEPSDRAASNNSDLLHLEGPNGDMYAVDGE